MDFSRDYISHFVFDENSIMLTIQQKSIMLIQRPRGNYIPHHQCPCMQGLPLVLQQALDQLLSFRTFSVEKAEATK